MIKNYVPSEYKEVIIYELVFDDGCNNGFAFPCTETLIKLFGFNQKIIGV